MTTQAHDFDGHRPVQRVRQAHVEWVAQRLSERDRAIIETFAHVRLATSMHLERLHFTDVSPLARSRVRRRVLARLRAWRVLMVLERRIGGVRAGSAGLVFALDTAGRQLVTPSGEPRTQHRPREPSVVLLGHNLAATELYVRLTEASPTVGIRISFSGEPAAWWPLPTGGWLKPDVYLTLSTSTVRDHWWIEVDRATEHLPVIRRKLLTYLAHAEAGGGGPNGTMPRLLMTVPTEQRRDQVQGLIDRLPETGAARFFTATESDAPSFLLRQALT